MKRPAEDYLNEITAAAEQWLRRCNGQPADGIPMSARGLRIVLASSRDVRANDNGIISWQASAGQFTAEPVRA